jgi:serine/threonine protein phosphatase PrpC
VTQDLHLVLHMEAVATRGEDAEPLFVADAGWACLHLAVFDGLGGAGARPVANEDGHTEAYVAARLARDALRELLTHELPCADLGRVDAPERVAAVLREALHAMTDLVQPSRVISHLKRTLPTTVALASVTRDRDEVVVRALWAGDSRVYALTPTEGLVQLTGDHTRYLRDPFTAPYRESPLANAISADRAFFIDAALHAFRLPMLIITATDGCFGYWPSPMHFEEALLDSMCRARSVEEWRSALEERIGLVAGDDASLVAAAPGVRSLTDLAGGFRDRLARLRAEFLPAPPAVDASFHADLRERWDRYRLSYESRLAATPSAEEP